MGIIFKKMKPVIYYKPKEQTRYEAGLEGQAPALRANFQERQRLCEEGLTYKIILKTQTNRGA